MLKTGQPDGSNAKIGVLIPSYDRPEMLETSLLSWLNAESVNQLFIVAEASSKCKFEKYQTVLKEFAKNRQVTSKVASEKMGSVNARNYLLDLASQHSCDYIVMADDDYILQDKNSLALMVNTFELNSKVGAVGGKVIVKCLRQDGDFYLNLPLNLSDVITKLTGYIFLDIVHGPRYCEFLTPFFMTKKEVLNKKIRYDKIFDTPTSFREESDLQLQIKRSGYALLYDPNQSVIHLAAEEGGNRPKLKLTHRMYWKAHNNEMFIFKWNKSFLKRFWYTLFSCLILTVYRVSCVSMIFKGIKDGIHDYKLELTNG